MFLTFRNINKAFGAVPVLKDINLELGAGEVLGLVGENGAGKSTLMNILGGIVQPTTGEILIEEQPFAPRSANDALEKGIALIHQELNLFSNLSIAENLFLHSFPSKKIAGIPFISKAKSKSRSRQLLQMVGLDLSPNTIIENLTPAQRQLVEIAKAMGASPRIIILDEPTTSLTRPEIENLFALIDQLRSEQIAIVYISHNLEDVLRLADKIAILRDGALVGLHDRAAGFNLKAIINAMVGRDMDQYFPERSSSPGKETLLTVQDLSATGILSQVSFQVKKGEILGFFGLVGAGRTEMARMIFGLDPFETGTLLWKGRPVLHPTPAKWIRQKVAFLTEDRREEGLLLDLNIEKNIRLAGLPRFIRTVLKWIDFRAARSAAEQYAEATRVKYRSRIGQLVSTLSGGNQQKVVLAKWLLTEPELLILDEPTKGIDIGAKHEIYRLINDLTDHGTSALLISSELEELMGMCDRILVMSQGKIKAEFEKEQFEKSALLEAALHGAGPSA